MLLGVYGRFPPGFTKPGVIASNTITPSEHKTEKEVEYEMLCFLRRGVIYRKKLNRYNLSDSNINNKLQPFINEHSYLFMSLQD